MRFAALRAPWYKGYLAGGTLLMAGDNAEHALSYFAMWQLFHSPLLAGFATVAHWVPHLLFAVAFGAMADRYDNRRIIQLGCALFVLVSIAWGVLLLAGALTPLLSVLLLVAHGFASAIWRPADQTMLFDLVGEKDLPSAVRLMATGLSLGQLVGPALGAVLLFTIGPAVGLLLNALFYLPFVVYLFLTPATGHRRGDPKPRARLREVYGVVRELPARPRILSVLAMQAAAAVFVGVGSALLPLFPEFGAILGQDEEGLGYGLLIGAMAAGAVVGGIGTEAFARRLPSTPAVAGWASVAFAISCLVFGASPWYPLSLAALFAAGATSIIASSAATTVVQLEAPPERRGRYMGLNAVASLGARAGSGLLLGLLATAIGVPWAVVLASTAFAVAALALAFAAGRLPARAA